MAILAGFRLYFMLLKQQPFVHSDVETAVNQSIAQELDLPEVLGVEVPPGHVFTHILSKQDLKGSSRPSGNRKW